MQLAVAKEIMRIDNKSLEVTSSGTFIQRLTGDTGTIADAFYYMTYLTTDILRDIGIFIAIFVISKEIFIYALLTFLAIYIINYRKTKISG
jgi:ABC-type multidrug transport system fused ATPase/permease subunit